MTYWLAGLEPAMLRLMPWAYMAPRPLIGSLEAEIDRSPVSVPVAMQAARVYGEIGLWQVEDAVVVEAIAAVKGMQDEGGRFGE